MKCHKCDIEMKKVRTNYILEGIKLLENIDAEQCPKCGEKVIDAETSIRAEAVARKAGIFGIGTVAIRKISKVGNSLTLNIPKEIARILNIEKGGEAILKIVGKNKILVQLE